MWQFWIDVGGTFTDCIGRSANGQLLRHKVLSSAVTKGWIDEVESGPSISVPSISAPVISGPEIIDASRRGDPENFWVDSELWTPDRQGVWRRYGMVESSTASGRIRISATDAESVRPGMPYELISAWESPLLAIRYLLGLAARQPLPPVMVQMGTTRGTNALLTRTGARTAFVTTKGLGDILRIGNQNRPDLFAIEIHKPEMLFERVIEISERISADGRVLVAPDPLRVYEQLAAVRRVGIDALAICLLHGDRFPEHERVVAEQARRLGFAAVSVSHEVTPLAKIVPRGDTTVLDAYLTPTLRDYLQRILAAIGGDGDRKNDHPKIEIEPSRLRVLTSAGGLVSADRFSGKDSILSGPAGGVVGYAKVAQAAGFQKAIGFDMGGTSTDVSRFDGRYEMELETEKAGVRMMMPMLAIETVASGGGSVCGFDGGRLFVGPQSAGADPGPACYGRGGPLAITDMNFFLGRILQHRFPFRLHREPVIEKLEAVRAQILSSSGQHWSNEQLACGFLTIANTQMSQAVRSISVTRGYDPREYALVPFGGAAGQHACDLANELGSEFILSHPDAGILSAYGIGLADVVKHRFRTFYRPLKMTSDDELKAAFQELTEAGLVEVESEGIDRTRIDFRRSLELRYKGLEASLTVDVATIAEARSAYEAAHKRRYGYCYPEREIELVSVHIEITGHSPTTLPSSRAVPRYDPSSQGNSRQYIDGLWRDVAVFEREKLRPGAVIDGPAIVAEQHATTVIASSWRGAILSAGELLISRLLETPSATQVSNRNILATNVHSPVDVEQEVEQETDPFLLEVICRNLTAIAEQMGLTLRNTATSVNVKERLDFSCAIFTASGELVVNAPHIPVHLGAMAETVKAILADNPIVCPGDVFVTNDPYRGGSHLPDVTVVTPVHDPQSGNLWFLTASRAHHAEIGGITPGSMPPFSHRLDEEGVLISNFKLVDRGEPCWSELQQMLISGPYPSRSPADNLVDIEAQVAANQQGRLAVEQLVRRYSWPVVNHYMTQLQRVAEQKVRAAIAKLTPGRYRFLDHLDNGAQIEILIEVEQNHLTFDFRGTSDVLDSNLNANRAIVIAAVMYAIRCLLREDVPLNQGLLAPVSILLPECLLNPRPGRTPGESPAIVGGNVETSQRVVDVIFGALQLAAASQGTMNNLLFGDSTFGYYETICGGAGATIHAPGADAVHTHMTNTRLTDPEVLEMRFPVRLNEFSIRRGSGGSGRNRGGDGIVRRLEFLKPLQVSILSQRRGPYPPFGLAGGGAGQLGCNRVLRVDGTLESLGGCVQIAVKAGDQIIVETPGGGAYGKP